MQPPDDDSVQLGGLDLEGNEVAYAALIQPAAVVYDEHVAGFSSVQRLQEDIDAAGMSRRTGASGDAAAGHHGLHSRRRTPHRDLGADAGIRNVGSG
jgi:hypothetical protein